MTKTAVALLLSAAAADAPRVDVRPPRARPGDAVAVEVRGPEAPPRAAVAGRALQFFPAGPERWRAFAGLPVETPPGELVVSVAGGATRLRVAEPGWRETRLTVPPRFTEQRPPEVERRIEEDRAAFAAACAQPPSPPLFHAPFAWPRRARITARYGDRRTFNGATQGQHYGTDLAGPVGAPVRAANDGEVVLVRDAWASGNSVVLFHGANLYTVYFHLSATRVAVGDRVRRGDVVGLLGATGRASGPHLHWGARVGDLYVDPESLLRLTAPTAARPR